MFRITSARACASRSATIDAGIGILQACREKRKRVQARRTAGFDHRIDRRQITGLKKRAVEDDGGNGGAFSPAVLHPRQVGHVEAGPVKPGTKKGRGGAAMSVPSIRSCSA